MAGYGAYSKTSYGAQGGEDGGGFVYGASQGGSQGQGGSKPGYADESLRPVTIKQLHEVVEDFQGHDATIDGRLITQITFLAQVRSILPQSTNITYRVDDGTGTMEVKKWIDADRAEDEGANGAGGGGAATKFPLDSYVRIWGRLKTFNQKRHVSAHAIRAVEDFNEVGYHFLEVAYIHLLFTKGPLGADGQLKGAGGDGQGDSMFVDQQGAGGGQQEMANPKLASCSPGAQRVFKWLLNEPGGDIGIHFDQIKSGTMMGNKEMVAATDELVNNGMIYTTTDEDTFAVLQY